MSHPLVGCQLFISKYSQRQTQIPFGAMRNSQKESAAARIAGDRYDEHSSVHMNAAAVKILLDPDLFHV